MWALSVSSRPFPWLSSQITFIIVAGISVCLYFLSLCGMVRCVFRNIGGKIQQLPAMPEARRLRYKVCLVSLSESQIKSKTLAEKKKTFTRAVFPPLLVLAGYNLQVQVFDAGNSGMCSHDRHLLHLKSSKHYSSNDQHRSVNLWFYDNYVIIVTCLGS